MESQLQDGSNSGEISSRLIQQLDLALWLFGKLPDEVYAAGRKTTPGEPNGSDCLQVHLGFPQGGMALITYARTLPAGERYDSLTLIGSTGAGYADDHGNTHLLYRGGNPAAVKTGEGELHFAAQLRDFVNAIAGDREPSISGADGLAAAEVGGAVQLSLQCEKPVHLDGGRYEPA